ncbi:MAG TPA: sigma-70 family RNA polymerase sigma factor [Verrucomicrobiae bacterium]|jgi:RNA polymerase sigma factor (sigma-70 family)
MQELDDSSLLREYAESASEAAFAALVRRHINKVYSVALRHTGNPAQAEEITQAVFVILAKKSRHLGRGVIVSGWLYQTARFTAITFLRSEIRRVRREQEAYMQSSLNEDQPDLWRQIAPLLDAGMARLNEKDRHAIVLRYFDGKSMSEVGAALGANEDAAKKRVGRALEKLRNFFTKRGVISTTAIIAGVISANSVQAAPATLANSVGALAIAKGAAGSASTLTLIKGALKIMAWTKAKTTIVTSAAIILIATTTILVSNHFRGASPRLKLPTGQVNPMIAYGYSRYAVALASGGSLWSWGEERLGWPVLGLNNNIRNTTSLRRIGNDSDWVSVAVGGSHCLAIKSDGSLWAWGANFRYQLGDGTKITRPVPVRSVPGNDWKQAAAAGDSSYALKNDGTLWAWGGGYLGNGRLGNSGKAVQVGSATNWKKIWAGGIQTVGLQSDGTLWFWGSLTGGGSNDTTTLVPTRISPDTNWIDVCFGYFTVLAIKSDGTLWSWGREANFYTQAPDSSNSVPTQVGTDTDWDSCSSSPGCFYHLLRKKDGSLWAIDASEHRTIKPAAAYAPLKPEKIDWQTDITAFAAGGDDIGIVLRKNGEVWTWGRVIGKFSPKDYITPTGQSLDPQPTVIQKPWRLSNIASSR